MSEAAQMSATQRAPPKGSGALASLAGSILYGRRPEDQKARKRATVGGIAVTLLGIVAGVVIRGEARTDRMLAEQREDLRATVREIKGLATEVRGLSIDVKDLASQQQAANVEARRMQSMFLEKIPNARPQPYPLRLTPGPRQP